MKTCWFCGADNATNMDSYIASGINSRSKLFGWVIQSRHETFIRCRDCAELHKIIRYPGFLGAVVGLTAMIKFGWPLIGACMEQLFKIENLFLGLIALALLAAGAGITVRIPFWGYRLFVLMYLKLRGLKVKTPWQADESVRLKMIKKEID